METISLICLSTSGGYLDSWGSTKQSRPIIKMLTKYSLQNTHFKKKKKKKKIPCLTKKIYHVPKFYSDQYLMSNKILHVKKKIFQWPTKIFPCPTQKIHTAIKNLSHTHVNKNVHTHEIRLTRSNKISTFIKNEFVRPSRHIKFSWLQCPQNSSQNTFNNTTK